MNSTTLLRHRDNDLLSIYDHFGANAQLEKLQEEIREFSEAYKQWAGSDYSPIYWDHLVEEYADVKIVLDQFRKNILRQDKKYTFHSDLYDAETRKIARTIKRIKEGYYDEKE